MCTEQKSWRYIMSKEVKVLIGEGNEFAFQCAKAARESGYIVKTCQLDNTSLFKEINRFLPDFVLCEAFMPGGNAADLIESTQNIEKVPFFIVTSEYKNAHIEREIMSVQNAYLLIKPFEPSIFIKAVQRITPEEVSDYTKNEKTINIEKIVTDIIHEVGIPANVNGYKYLRKAITLSVDEPVMLESITKMLYPAVARYFSTTPSRVERAIRHSIENAWDRGDSEVLKNLFGSTVSADKGKPTNSEFIALITDKLRMQFKNQNYEKNNEAE